MCWVAVALLYRLFDVSWLRQLSSSRLTPPCRRQNATRGPVAFPRRYRGKSPEAQAPQIRPSGKWHLPVPVVPLRPRKHPLLEDDSRARLGDEGPDRAVGGNRL